MADLSPVVTGAGAAILVALLDEALTYRWLAERRGLDVTTVPPPLGILSARTEWPVAESASASPR